MAHYTFLKNIAKNTLQALKTRFLNLVLSNSRKNVAAAREHLKKNAVEIVEEPILPGRDRFAFIDPFGNRMELLQVTGT